MSTRMQRLAESAALCSLYVRAWSPGDGVTRYRFFTDPTATCSGCTRTAAATTPEELRQSRLCHGATLKPHGWRHVARLFLLGTKYTPVNLVPCTHKLPSTMHLPL